MTTWFLEGVSFFQMFLCSLSLGLFTFKKISIFMQYNDVSLLFLEESLNLSLFTHIQATKPMGIPKDNCFTTRVS